MQKTKKQNTNIILYVQKRKTKQSQIGLSTKHSFITTDRNNADRGECTAAYFFACDGCCWIFCIFCCAFRPFLLCFLAKRMFLRNLGSICKRIDNFINIGHNLQSHSNSAKTKKTKTAIPTERTVTKRGSEHQVISTLKEKNIL